GGMGPGGMGPGGMGPGGMGPGGMGPGGGSPPMMNEGMVSSPPGSFPGGDMQSGSVYPGMGGSMGVFAATPGQDGEEYRLFRFLDTDVAPGKKYVYRARLAVRNPNMGVPARYLKESSLGTNPWIVSDHSEPSKPVMVPGAIKVLARALAKDGTVDSLKEMKIRNNMAELLVLAESQETGRLTLRSVIAEAGGVINVDENLNKKGGLISKGEAVKTGAILLDLRGSQVDRMSERAMTKTASKSTPQQPLEALVFEPDGKDGFVFRVVSLVESEHAVDVFRKTLPREVVSGGEATPGQGYSPQFSQ
ncbi:MAG: hypothetical protein ACKOCN_08735, partial [Planctomycetaceae bacterium]